MARITLYGWLNYMPNLFDDIVLPEGIDRATLVNEIIKSSGDLYTYHQAPAALKQNIDFWFSRKSYDFEMILKALRSEYNPLENYDRREEISRTHSNNGTDSSQTTSSANASGNSSSNSNGTSTDKVSAYNAADFQNQAQTINGQNSSDQNSQTSRGDSSTQTTYNSGYAEGETNRIHGNIGTTMAQEMITREVNLRISMDMYRIIGREFEKEFLIQVY